MSRLLKVAAAFAVLVSGVAVGGGEASAAPRYCQWRPWLPECKRAQPNRMCQQTTCVRRAPFVCKGPIGSCGFQQGACLQQVTQRVPCGTPPVVR